MKRRLFTILPAASLLLCAVTCVLWVRSYYSGDLIFYVSEKYPRHGSLIRLISSTGRVVVSRDTVVPLSDGSAAFELGTSRRGFVMDSYDSAASPFRLPGDRLLSRFGFSAGAIGTWEAYDGVRDVFYTQGIERHVAFPHYAAVGTLLVLPAVWTRRLLSQRRRASAGLCTSCGYDLRATPGRCPECGAGQAGKTVLWRRLRQLAYGRPDRC